MLTYRNLNTLGLLLLCVSGSALKFNLFNKINDRQEGNIRLVGSKSVSEGRVEVYHDGKWGTVCDDEWDINEAQVVCRQLNFPGAKSVVFGKDYGQAPGPIWLDDIACKGTETQLVLCEFKGWGVTDCSHKEDVGVICETGSKFKLRSNSTHSLDHSISLSDGFGQIFDSGIGCDFQIFLQSPTGKEHEDGTPEIIEETICAHKMFLSLFPFFGASSGMTNITVSFSISCQSHFTSFIRYFYTYKIDVTSSSAMCLHQMASKFGVKQLKADIGRLFTQILPEDTSFSTQVSLYQYAVESEDLILEENCIQFFAWNYQKLTSSPAWTSLSVELLRALLTRSDLVAPDEYFVLQTVEKWITENASSISLETQADLLSHIRFPMIPAEKLYELESNSPLYNTHKNMYLERVLKAFHFNVLLFNNILTNPKFKKEDLDYKPRIYTATPWSIELDFPRKMSSDQGQPVHQYSSYNRRRYDYGYGYYYATESPYIRSNSFVTPVHNSLIFQGNTTTWEAEILSTMNACSRKGLRCESVPAARLDQRSYYTPQSNILFRNRLLLMCQNRYICQVQGFKDNLAYVSTNGTQAFAYPCPDDNYKYIFVVRPEYI
ncbi:galectin-3-binding protein A-like [Melanotaenia boesemani]|uniref:galectin-3-binding protein A-like n=1 Tax=Melanotaenia boesemani TaxID=1250792 RepID=UPI001C05BAA1|nr:galectin-3-binding protein A-like [Melanotaenia boesemani]